MKIYYYNYGLIWKYLKVTRNQPIGIMVKVSTERPGFNSTSKTQKKKKKKKKKKKRMPSCLTLSIISYESKGSGIILEKK